MSHDRWTTGPRARRLQVLFGSTAFVRPRSRKAHQRGHCDRAYGCTPSATARSARSAPVVCRSRPCASGGRCDRVDETAAVMRMRTQRCGRATALLRAVRIGSHDARTGRSKRPRTQGCATLTVASRAEGSGRHASDPDVRPSSSGSADGCRLREQSVRTRHAAPRAMLAGMRESRATEKGTPRAEFSFQRTQHGASRLARRRPTLPLTYASSTIGSGGLDFRVRDGIG